MHCGRLQCSLATELTPELECCLCHGELELISMYLADIKKETNMCVVSKKEPL